MASSAETLYPVDPSIVAKFNELKIRHKFKWIFFGLQNDHHVSMEECSDMKKDVKDLVKALPEAECRYVIFEHVYNTSDGRPQAKLFFISWFPRAASAPQKMLYTTARSSLRTACAGCIDLPAGAKSEILDALTKGGSGGGKDDDEASDDGGGDWMDS
jgi:cofilin